MASISENFATNLTAALNAITASKIYTDIETMYTEGRLQKDQLDKVVIAFHEKAIGMAGAVAENLTYKGYKFEELIDAELTAKQAEASLAKQKLETEKQRTLLIENQKIGFLDNRVLEWSKISSEVVGMIQSGGNEAPQAMMDAMTKAEQAVQIIALEHPQLEEYKEQLNTPIE